MHTQARVHTQAQVRLALWADAFRIVKNHHEFWSLLFPLPPHLSAGTDELGPAVIGGRGSRTPPHRPSALSDRRVVYLNLGLSVRKPACTQI